MNWLKNSDSPLYEKIYYIIGISCLGRKTELYNLCFSDIKVIHNKELNKEEILIDLGRLKSDARNADQSVLISNDYFVELIKRYFLMFLLHTI